MKIFQKILLYYGAFVSVALAFSTVMVSLETGNMIIPILFLPVPFFFVIMAFKTMKRSKIKRFVITRNRAFIIFSIFIVLLTIGLVRVFTIPQKTQETSNGIEQEIPSPSKKVSFRDRFKETEPLATPSSEIKESLTPVSVNLYDNTPFLNIRKGPSSSFEIIGKAMDGDEYLSASSEGMWYEIVLEGDERGWVYRDYIIEIEEVENSEE